MNFVPLMHMYVLHTRARTHTHMHTHTGQPILPPDGLRWGSCSPLCFKGLFEFCELQLIKRYPNCVRTCVRACMCMHVYVCACVVYCMCMQEMWNCVVTWAIHAPVHLTTCAMCIKWIWVARHDVYQNVSPNMLKSRECFMCDVFPLSFRVCSPFAVSMVMQPWKWMLVWGLSWRHWESMD